ncbi:unnamed protein product [Prunus brigantina]
MEMEKCMIHEKELTYNLWCEAMNIAVYLLNRSPTKALESSTPFERFSGRKPGIKHLKVFGSMCYPLVPGDVRHKLEATSVMGVFIGYDICEKGYRILNPITQKVILSRDVIFDEHGKCHVCIIEPECFDKAAKDEAWRKAMENEISMIEKNQTWELVNRPFDKPVIGVKWVYKTKLNLDESIQKNKAKLVAKGYAQKPGIDYNETFAPVARLDTIRTLIALAAKNNWKLYQLDVKSAFLNGVLEEEVYIEQPDEFLVKGKEDKVYKLHKALYGLKQAPRAWYGEIDSYLVQCGFKRSTSEATLYVKCKGNSELVIVSIYVDDIVYTGNSQDLLQEFKSDMMQKYEMTDLGLLYHFLGMGVIQSDNCIFLHQRKYASTPLQKFGLQECKSVSIPLVPNDKLRKDDDSGAADEAQYRKLVGSLLYLTATRPDIMYAACTLDFGLEYKKEEGTVLIGFCDSDWSGSEDDMRSTSGYAFTFGSGVFSWASVKQQCVALSTAKAEYISASEATAQATWLRFVLEDFGEMQAVATPLNCDNTSAIANTKNPIFNQKIKHINWRYHYIKEALQQGVIDLLHCPTKEQVADIFTQALTREQFSYLRELLGVKSVHNLKGSVNV